MKKVIIIITALFLSFALIACGSDDVTTTVATTGATTALPTFFNLDTLISTSLIASNFGLCFS